MDNGVQQDSAVSKEGRDIAERSRSKRHATDAQTAQDVGATGDTSKPKGHREVLALEFEYTLYELQERWQRAYDKGRELVTVMRDTNNWVYLETTGDFAIYGDKYRESEKNRSNDETAKLLDNLWKIVLIKMEWSDAALELTKDAVGIVQEYEGQENMLEKMERLIGLFNEVRNSKLPDENKQSEL